MNRLIVAALLTGAAVAHAQTASAPPASAPVSAAKKELVQKLLKLQQPAIEAMARNLVEQPAMQLTQAAGRALQQVPADKRDAAGKSVDADVRKFVDEAVPIARDHAVKLAPSTIGAVLEEKFTDDEIKQLIAWFDSPVSRKFSSLGPEIQGNFSQKLIVETRPLLEPRLQALEVKVCADLGLSAPAPGASAAAAAPAPAKKASAK